MSVQTNARSIDEWLLRQVHQNKYITRLGQWKIMKIHQRQWNSSFLLWARLIEQKIMGGEYFKFPLCKGHQKSSIARRRTEQTGFKLGNFLMELKIGWFANCWVEMTSVKPWKWAESPSVSRLGFQTSDTMISLLTLSLELQIPWRVQQGLHPWRGPHYLITHTLMIQNH